jgi:hypothetical protein
MGSGNDNRKKNDTTYVRRPKSITFSGTEVPGGYGGETVADICIPSFEVKIAESGLARPGIKVHLTPKGEIYQVTIGGTVIATINTKKSKMIAYCSKMGVKYLGAVVKQKDGLYARFIRNT